MCQLHCHQSYRLCDVFDFVHERWLLEPIANVLIPRTPLLRGGKAKVKSPILLLWRASSSGRELCMNEWMGDVHVTSHLKTDIFPNKATHSLFPVFNFPTLNRVLDRIIISWMHNAPLYLPPYMYAYMWEPSHGPHQALTFTPPSLLPPCS